LVIGDGAIGEAGDEELDLIGAQLAAVSFLLDDVDCSHTPVHFFPLWPTLLSLARIMELRQAVEIWRSAAIVPGRPASRNDVVTRLRYIRTVDESRFSRGSWIFLAVAVLLVAVSIGQLVYRLSQPTDGWVVDPASGDVPLMVFNLLGGPSPLQ